ncbi:protein spire homolog 1-like [Mixophyes fleayi]|uniref:protein spire homolog 1-like n=1 Tax=Mixophyes fleayi TaxID=3061075 RepID=UPI003F4DCACA
MNERGPSVRHSKVTLKEILDSSGQPISEEQAWALCYQCSCKLKQTMLGAGQFPTLRGIESIYVHQDGTVSFAPSTVEHDSNLLEKKIIEWLGKAVYTALDWGLSSEIERVLGDSLDNLLLCMLGLNSAIRDSATGNWQMFLLNDVIKECVERMCVPSEASAHYTAICRIQFAQHKDICKLLQTIERSKQTFEKLDPNEDLTNDTLLMCENWCSLWTSVMNELRLGISLRSTKERSYNPQPVEYALTPYERLIDDIRYKRYTLRKVTTLKRSSPKEDLKGYSLIIDENLCTVWSTVMNELHLGISLRSAKERTYNALPVEYTLTPYEQLMNDIRSKRYSLRPVKECDQNKSSKSEENVILDLIRSHTLKPASERKLKERSQEEPSLHEQLMSEIKSSKTLRATLDVKRSLIQDEEFKTSNILSSAHRDHSLYGCRMGSRWGQLPAIDLLDNGIDGRISWHSEFSHESSSENKFSDLTSSSTELSFFPVLTSSQVDLRMNSILNHEKLRSGHKRSCSYEGSIQGHHYRQSWRTPGIRLSPTISELVPIRRATIKAEMVVFTSSAVALGNKACSSCYRKRLFFCWPYSCKFCDRTICPKCHIEMLMPFKQCMHLPVSFFKALVLSQESDPVCQAQKNGMFLREVLHWDYSSVPLVFEPKDVTEISFHKRIMCNWTCMDICVKCEEYILDVIDMSQSDFAGSSLKSRSCSESSATLPRH